MSESSKRGNIDRNLYWMPPEVQGFIEQGRSEGWEFQSNASSSPEVAVETNLPPVSLHDVVRRGQPRRQPHPGTCRRKAEIEEVVHALAFDQCVDELVVHEGPPPAVDVRLQEQILLLHAEGVSLGLLVELGLQLRLM